MSILAGIRSLLQSFRSGRKAGRINGPPEPTRYDAVLEATRANDECCLVRRVKQARKARKRNPTPSEFEVLRELTERLATGKRRLRDLELAFAEKKQRAGEELSMQSLTAVNEHLRERLSEMHPERDWCEVTREDYEWAKDFLRPTITH